MHTAILFPISLLALLASAQTMQPISEIGDGQPQAPGGTASSSSYSNPMTSYTTQTNSLGVITGQPTPATSQPSVVTSQPSVVTSQPSAATQPAGVSPTYSLSSYFSGPVPTAPGPVVLNSTTFSTMTSGGSNVTVTTSSPTSTSGSSGGATSAGGSSGSGSTAAPTTGNAAGALHAGLGLVVAAVGFSVLL